MVAEAEVVADVGVVAVEVVAEAVAQEVPR